MSSRERTWLWAVIAGGLAVRLIVAFATGGLAFDLNSLDMVRQALVSHPGHVYSLLNTAHLFRWPYPSGYFPIVWLVGLAHTGFRHLIRIPPMLADAGLAWLVADHLGRQGASPRVRLAAAAAVSFGPVFIAISAYNGQFDSVAILPAVAAVMLWERLRPPRRAPLAGLLLGLGGAVKTVPVLLVLALLPTARSRREAAVLVGSAACVLAVAIVPWLVSDGHALVMALKYRSLAGQGGLSLLVQPNLAGIWLGGPYHQLSGLSSDLQGTLGSVIALAALAAGAAALLYLRAPVIPSALLLWMTAFAFGINFSPRYAVWLLPFLLMDRRILSSVALQLLLILPTALLLAAPFANHDVRYIYVPLMLLAWLAFTAGAVGGFIRLGRCRPWPRPSQIWRGSAGG